MGATQDSTTPPLDLENPSDVTMASLTRELAELRAEIRGQPPPRDRTSFAYPDNRPRTGITKPRHFSNLPGENFLAWKSQFQVIAEFNRWTPAEAKSMAYAYMSGTALETVMDIDLDVPTEGLTELLGRYQDRFLPSSRSQMLRAQFNFVVQLPQESVQKLHSRLRVLYHLAYPKLADRSEVTLIERFIQALNNRQVQNHVRRRKPTTYSEALDMAQEETSFVLMDAVTHAPGGPQQPIPGETSFIGALQGRPHPGGAFRSTQSEKRCFYCEGNGHFKDRCPLRLKDLLRRKLSQNLPPRGPSGNALKAPTAQGNPRTGSAPPPRRWVPSGNRQSPSFAVEGYGIPRGAQPAAPRSYGNRQVATIQEEEAQLPEVAASQDPLDDYDFSNLDDATISALYEAACEGPDEGPLETEEDFPEGQ